MTSFLRNDEEKRTTLKEAIKVIERSANVYQDCFVRLTDGGWFEQYQPPPSDAVFVGTRFDPSDVTKVFYVTHDGTKQASFSNRSVTRPVAVDLITGFMKDFEE